MHDASCAGRATSSTGRGSARAPFTTARLEALTRLVKAGHVIPLRSWLDLVEHAENQTAQIVEWRALVRDIRAEHGAELEAHGFHAAAAILRSPPVGAALVDHTVPIPNVRAA